MPRPTAAQFVYGSATVVLSTLAMLLLSQTRSAAGIALVACAGLVLGLLVAMTVPVPRAVRTTPRPGGAVAVGSPARTGGTPEAAREHASAGLSAGAPSVRR